MPSFVNSHTGSMVDAANATYPNGRVKPGFHEMLGDGEYISFIHAFRDAAPKSGQSVFLTDNPKTNTAQVRDAAKAARKLHPVAHHFSTSDAANLSKGNTASIRDAVKAARNR